MFKFVLSASLLLGCLPIAAADSSADRQQATRLERSVALLRSSEDYRSASDAAFRLASAHSGLGETAAACAALSQSLEHYRQAVAIETGVTEAAASSINDDSDGMAAVRARFGCRRA